MVEDAQLANVERGFVRISYCQPLVYSILSSQRLSTDKSALINLLTSDL